METVCKPVLMPGAMAHFEKLHLGPDVTLYCGNCLELLPLPADVLITDPPYGIDLEAHDKTGLYRRETRKIVNDHSQDVGIAALALYKDIPVIVFANPMRPWPGEWRQYLVWDKGGAVGGGGDIATMWKLTWELIQVARTGKLNGRRDPAVLRFLARPQEFRFHPAVKPLKLMLYLISKVTQPGEMVIDPFMGSGTTGIAAVKLGRKFTGIEIDPHNFNIAAKRIKEAQMQPALFDLPAGVMTR